MANKNKYATTTPVEKSTGTSPTLPKNPAPVKTVQNPSKGADAELPVQNPGAGAQTMSTPTAAPASESSGYTTTNDQVWNGENGGYDAYKEQVKQEKENLNPEAVKPITPDELDKVVEQLGVDPSQYATGGYNQNGIGVETPLPGTGEAGWYYDEGKPRDKIAGTSGADEDLLSAEGYAAIQGYKKKWDELEDLAKQAEASGNSELAAQYRAERDLQNVYANQIRAAAGYYGGADGSMYIPVGELQDSSPSGGSYTGSGGSGGIQNESVGGMSAGAMQTAQMLELLEAWKQAAEKQGNGQVDFAVQQAITQLERALEDAQPQIKEQAESVSLDERQAMDNAALYAELRGDKGGIGQEQYSSIQNTAAQNRLAVQQAQTKLSTDTARQIEDLRAQGEFEKADKALEITQTYLAQLISLEQWAAEYNLSVEQFNAQLHQWEMEYQLALKQLDISQNQWQQEFAFQQEQAAIGNSQWQQQFDAALDQWRQEFGFNQQQAAISNNQWQQQFDAALDQWRQEFGLDQQQFQAALDQWEKEFNFQQEQAAQNLTGGTDPNTIYQDLFNAGYTSESDPEEIANYLAVNGVDTKLVDAYASQFITRGYGEASEANGWGKGIPEWQNFFGVIKQYAMGGNVAKVDEMMSQYGGMMTAEQWKTLQKFFDSIGFDITNIK